MRTRVHGPAGRVARSARVCAPRTGGVRVYTEHTWVCTRTHAKRGGDTRWGAAGWAERAALLGGGGGTAPNPSATGGGVMETLPWPWGAPCPPWPHKAYVSLGAQLQAWGGRSRWLQSGTGALPAAVRCQPPPRLGWRCHAICSPRLAPPPRHWASCHTAQPSLAGGLALPRGIFLWDGEEGRAGGGCGRIQSCCAACPYSLGDLQPLEELG